MRYRHGAAARALAGAGLALLVAVSCPNPIDRELLLVVADDIKPTLAITAPQPNSYYRGLVTIRGTVTDSSRRAGDGQGRLETLSFSVSNEATLDCTVDFAADGNFTVDSQDTSFTWVAATGSYSFSFPSEGLDQPKTITIVARDVNNNETIQDISLQPYPLGPNLVLTSPTDFSVYGMQVNISGTVTDAPGDTTTDEIRRLEWQRSGEEPETHEILIDPTSPPSDGIYRENGGTFIFNSSDGTFQDSFSSFSFSKTIYLKITAENVNHSSSTTVTQYYSGTGPDLVLAPAATGHNPSAYSSNVPTFITIDGTVSTSNLDILKYSVWTLGGEIDPNMTTGAFSFTFDATSLSGNLTVKVLAKDNRGLSTTVEHLIQDDTTPPTGSPVVTGPATPTNDSTPMWTWTYSGAADFVHSLVGQDGPWTSTMATSWTPAAPLSEGSHTLWVRARDTVGNPSGAGMYALTVDTIPSTVGTFTIDSGAVYSTDLPVTLNSSVTDPNGVAQMRFSNDGVTWPTWESYATSKAWTLDGAGLDGSRTVHAEFKDTAGNVQTASDGIVLDRVAPQVSTFVINGGADWTGSASVTLSIAAIDPDPGTGPLLMRFSNNGTTWPNWDDYGTSKGWTLPDPDAAVKTVYAQFKDQAGNVTQVDDSIGLDRSNPSITAFRINGTDESTKDLNVTLTITATDGPNPPGIPYEMRFREDGGAWTDWEQPYAASRAWTLTASGDGDQTVSVEVRDRVGHTASASDTIYYDTTPPTVSSFAIDNGNTYSTDLSVTLNSSVTDPPKNMGEMRFSNDGSIWSTWETYAASKTGWPLEAGADGGRIVYAEFRDKAGNVTPASDSILLDRAGPVVSTFLINNGDAWTSVEEVTLAISASDPATPLQMRFRNEGESWPGTWEPYETSMAFTITGSDAVSRYVYAQFRDQAGNVTQVDDSIGLDRSNPNITTFVINNDTSPTTSLEVTLTIAATDGPTGTPYEMRLSNIPFVEPDLGWVSYAGGDRTWTLDGTGGDGNRRVYLQVRDRLGHTDAANDQIYYDGPD